MLNDAKKKSLCFSAKTRFKHDPLAKLKIEQVNTPSGRHYVTPDGHFTSVTTWLSSLDKPEIDAWKLAVGEKEANRIADVAAGRGTNLHDRIERYLLNEKVEIPKVDFVGRSHMTAAIPVIDRITNIRLLESRLYSTEIGLAGTVDCVADFDGIPSIVDFKTSKRIKELYEIDNYFLQTTIYSIMLEERYGLVHKNLVILIFNELGRPSVFTDSRKNWIPKLVKLLKQHPVDRKC